MRKRALSESDEEDGDLERVPTVHATLVARLYEELRERGESLENFIADFAAAGYSLKKRTLMRWVKDGERKGRPLRSQPSAVVKNALGRGRAYFDRICFLIDDVRAQRRL